MIDDPHQGLGTARGFGDNRCSHCDAPLGATQHALVIRADNKVWLYCAACEDMLLAKFAVLRWP
jgi:hypothetical protein